MLKIIHGFPFRGELYLLITGIWYKSTQPFRKMDLFVGMSLEKLIFFRYCKDENLDHKVGIYCNLIGPLDQS